MDAKRRVEQRGDYWRQTLRLTVLLLSVWLLVTLGSAYYARELDRLTLFGFPLGFYMGAQGAQLVYLAIVGVYARCMERLEARHGVAAQDD